jgi:hypothetical protein
MPDLAYASSDGAAVPAPPPTVVYTNTNQTAFPAQAAAYALRNAAGLVDKSQPFGSWLNPLGDTGQGGFVPEGHFWLDPAGSMRQAQAGGVTLAPVSPPPASIAPDTPPAAPAPSPPAIDASALPASPWEKSLAALSSAPPSTTGDTDNTGDAVVSVSPFLRGLTTLSAFPPPSADTIVAGALAPLGLLSPDPPIRGLLGTGREGASSLASAGVLSTPGPAAARLDADGLPVNPKVGDVATDSQGNQQQFQGVDSQGAREWIGPTAGSAEPDDPHTLVREVVVSEKEPAPAASAPPAPAIGGVPRLGPAGASAAPGIPNRGTDGIHRVPFSPFLHLLLNAGTLLPSVAGSASAFGDGLLSGLENDKATATFDFGSAAVGMFSDAAAAKAAGLVLAHLAPGAIDAGKVVIDGVDGLKDAEAAARIDQGAIKQSVLATEKGPRAPRAYTVAYETKLHPDDYGRWRGVHKRLANEALHAALVADPEFAANMEKMIPGLFDSVSKVGGRETPKGWVWHHAMEPGSMELIPEAQHAPGSAFQHLLHPDGKGGYATWAIPAGAPPN